MPLSLGPGHAAALDALQPSPYWGSERIWDTRVNNHNSMFGRDGRVWLAASVRGAGEPGVLQAGLGSSVGEGVPDGARRSAHLAVFDLKTKKYTFVDTCFSTHHLQFGYDANDTIWTSGGGPVVGWLNSKMFDQTGDAAKSQGWTALVLDTNGNGKRDAYVEPDAAAGSDEGHAHQRTFLCGDAESGGRIGLGRHARRPGRGRAAGARLESAGDGARRDLQRADARLRRARRRHRQQGRRVGFARQRPHGQLRSPQVQGAAERAKGHRRSLSRRLVVPSVPGPGFKGIGENSAESSYYSWVDQHNTFGLGNDVPMSTGNLNDGIIAFANGRMVVLRVPYPMGFYAKGFDGRIDDPKAGWKGARPVGRQRRPHAVADRRRQGNQAARRAFPAAARSARQVMTAGLNDPTLPNFQLPDRHLPIGSWELDVGS